MYTPCRFKSCENWRETEHPTVSMDDWQTNKCAICKRAYADFYKKKVIR